MRILQETVVEVRCRGCRRLLGIGPADFRIYCDDLCARDFPVATAEARDALIEAIFQKTSKSKTALAVDFGVSRQRVDQVLSSRRIRSPEQIAAEAAAKALRDAEREAEEA